MIDLLLNATGISLQSCDRAYQTSCLWGYASSGGELAEFGSAFHSFAEYLAKEPAGDIVKYFTDRPTKDKQLQKLCAYYQYSRPFGDTPAIVDTAGDIMVEYKFAVPYATVEDYQIIICGTIDRVDIHNGQLRVIDHKTARKMDVNAVLTEYEMHIQVPFYMWVLKHLLCDLLPDNAKALLADGAFFGYYNGVFLSHDPVKFALSKPIALTDDMDTAVKQIITGAIHNAIRLHKMGTALALPTGMANKACKYCGLLNLCRTRQDRNVLDFLATQVSKPYDPRTWR